MTNLTVDHRVAVARTMEKYAAQRRQRAHASGPGTAEYERGLYTALLMERATPPVLQGHGSTRQAELVLNTLAQALVDGTTLPLEEAADALATMYPAAWQD